MSTSWMGSDPARREAFERSLNIAGVGSVLMQSFINRVVQQLTVREFGLQAVLDRKAGSGLAAYVNRRTAGATGGAWVADTTAASEETGTYAQTTFTYRTLLTRGNVTRKAQAVGATYGDTLAGEIAAKAEDFAANLESALLIGDNGASPTQIDGLLTLCGAVPAQIIANTSAVLGDDLSLAQLDSAIDAVKGSSGRSDLVIVGSHNGLRQLNSALQQYQQFSDMTEIAAGFRVRTYDGIPIVASSGMPDAMTWSGTAISGVTGSVTTALAVVNKRYCWLEELTPQTVMPLAKTTSQNESFDMFWDGALVLGNTRGAAILGGISLS